MRYTIIVFLFAAAAVAQPVINAGGAANFASLAPDGLNNSGLAQGSIFVVNGTGLGAPNPTPINLFQNTVYPLPTSQGLNGTTVQLLGSETTYAVMLYESPTMVAAIIPSSTPTGPVSVTVTYNGQTSNAVSVHVVASALGLFTLGEFDGLPSLGSGPLVIENINSDGSTTLNTQATSARPGQMVEIYGTGLGAANGDESQGAVQAAGSFTFEILVGNQLAGESGSFPYYFGRLLGSGGYSAAGADTFVFQIPQGLQGCYVSVAIVAQGVTSNIGTMSIDPGGAVCSDSAFGYSSADFQQMAADNAARVGTVNLTSLTLNAPDGSSARQDSASAAFFNMNTQQLSSNLSGLPSAGSCFVIPFTGLNQPGLVPLGALMDAGPSLTLNGPDGTQQIAQATNMLSYNANFSQPFLDPGSFSVTGNGGASVGAFQGALNLPAAPQWLNAQTISTVGENSNLLITWSGGDPNGLIDILGLSVDTNLQAGAIFECAANSTAGQFTIPSYVLSWMPDTYTSVGILTVSAAGQARFQAPGLDVGYFQYSTGVGQPVQFIPTAQIF